MQVEPLLGATGAEPRGRSRAGVTARNEFYFESCKVFYNPIVSF
jgi:hypothetical protein